MTRAQKTRQRYRGGWQEILEHVGPEAEHLWATTLTLDPYLASTLTLESAARMGRRDAVHHILSRGGR